MKKAIVFDLDGTLLNSLPDLMDACNLALQEAGYPIHSLEDYRWMVGDGALELARRSLPEPFRQDEGLVQKMLFQQTEHYRHRWHSRSKRYSGILKHLRLLHRSPISLYVFSNKNEDFVKSIIEYYFPGVSFSGIIGYSKKYPRKPNPEALLMSFAQNGLLAQNALMIGDSAVDVQTAIQAGMEFIGAGYGFRGSQELFDAGALQVCSNVNQLFEAIQKWIINKEENEYGINGCHPNKT